MDQIRFRGPLDWREPWRALLEAQRERQELQAGLPVVRLARGAEHRVPEGPEVTAWTFFPRRSLTARVHIPKYSSHTRKDQPEEVNSSAETAIFCSYCRSDREVPPRLPA